MKPGVLSHQKISSFLFSEFDSRIKKNSQYSLRAFARDLSISPSRLSEILSGKHGLSREKAELIGNKLKLSSVEKKYWIQMVLAETSRSSRLRTLAQKKLKEWREIDSSRQLENDQFQIISEWYHGAILELLRLESFRPEISWIADKLGISVVTCEQAIERLKKLKLLSINDKGAWFALPEPVFAFSEVPMTAIRNFHRQVIENSLESITFDSIYDREIQSMILAFPKELLPQLNDELKQFMLDFWGKYKNEKPTDLYTFSVQFCPIKKRRQGAK